MRSCLLPPCNIHLNHFENLTICPSATMCNKEQETVTTSEPKQKITTEEIRRYKSEGRKRKRNEYTIKI
jgi:hypothetical protein